MDRLLLRQLRKFELSESDLPDESNWKALLGLISESYEDSEKDRQRLEHSIEINSEEMDQLNGQLKEQAEDRAKQLDQANTRHKLVLESLADAVITINKAGIIQSFNESAEMIFGYTRDEAIGKNVSMLMPEEDRESHQSFVKKTSIKKRSPIFHSFRELLGLRKDGHLFPIEINVTPFGNNSDQFVGIIRDITQRRDYEDQLLNAKDKAESGSRAKSKFLASMSHELRTPLNAILGFAELFEYSPGLNEQLKQNAKEIQSAGNHLLQLINEILDMSRIESGSIELSREPILISDLLNECAKLSQSLADKKNIIIDCCLEHNVTIISDYTKLKQVVLNLISNAIKYNRPNGKIECCCSPVSTQEILIEIKDTGKGIESSKMKQLFEPFNRLGKENSSIEGTGLGLTITKKLIQFLGGEIGATSEVNQGSCFWIKLPREIIKTTEITAKLTNKKDLKEKPLVLYIEDNPANRQFVSQISEYDNQYNFIFANDAESGIAKAVDTRPQLILMDIDLPGMDGFEALTRIKKNNSLNEIPIIAITSNTEQLKSDKMKASDFSRWVAKPVSVSELLRSISDVLKLKTTKKERG